MKKLICCNLITLFSYTLFSRIRYNIESQALRKERGSKKKIVKQIHLNKFITISQCYERTSGKLCGENVSDDFLFYFLSFLKQVFIPIFSGFYSAKAFSFTMHFC